MNDEHWTFAVTLYQHPGVAPACLLLQDELGVDVNVLLVALYAATTSVLDAGQEQIAMLDRVAKEIRTDIVAPLRTIRRTMKDRDYGVPTHGLREQIKALELKAERSVHDILVLRICQWNTPARSANLPRDVIQNVVAHYAMTQPESYFVQARIRDAIDLIAHAATESRNILHTTERLDEL